MSETREAMLEAGVRVYTSMAGDLLKGLTAGDVAREAGFHRQTFYRYWVTQGEYVQDLIRHLLAQRSPADGAEAVRQEAPVAEDMDTFVEHLARHDFTRVVEDRHAAMRIGLLMIEALRNGSNREATQEYYDRTMDALGEAYDDLLASWGRETVPGVTTRDLARMLQALVLGLVVQHKAATDDPTAPEVFERAARTLLANLTVPVGAGR